MAASLDLMYRVLATIVGLLSNTFVGTISPTMLAAAALALVAAAAIAIAIVLRTYWGPQAASRAPALCPATLVPPLVAQSHPDAAGHTRSRAPAALASATGLVAPSSAALFGPSPVPAS